MMTNMNSGRPKMIGPRAERGARVGQASLVHLERIRKLHGQDIGQETAQIMSRTGTAHAISGDDGR